MSDESVHVQSTEQFVRLLTSIQGSLYGYILSLLPDREAARDVLQEANVVLWRRSNDYRAGTNFTAWAFNVARHKVLAHHRDTARDRHIFGNTLFDRLAACADSQGETFAPLAVALEECVDALPGHQKALIRSRYASGGSVQRISFTNLPRRTVNWLTPPACSPSSGPRWKWITFERGAKN